MKKLCFPPVADETCVLVLGSFPGEMSLAGAQYYANPRNQFWRLTEGVIDVALCANRKKRALENSLMPASAFGM